MLIIIPNKCLYCHEDILHEKNYGEGLVQMDCKVSGFPPFEMKAVLSWCSVEHFLKWWGDNLKALNVVISKEEAVKDATEDKDGNNKTEC